MDREARIENASRFDRVYTVPKKPPDPLRRGTPQEDHPVAADETTADADVCAVDGEARHAPIGSRFIDVIIEVLQWRVLRRSDTHGEGQYQKKNECANGLSSCLH